MLSEGEDCTSTSTSTSTASLNVMLLHMNDTANADTITGAAGKKPQIDGLGCNDTITAGPAGDLIIGGAGTDILNGEAGVSTFAFSAGFGRNAINGFNGHVRRRVAL